MFLGVIRSNAYVGWWVGATVNEGCPHIVEESCKWRLQWSCARDHPNSEKNAPRMKVQEKIFQGWVPINSGNRSGSCSENCGFRIAQVVRCHSENGISYSENEISNSESCSENAPELSESSENGLFTPRAFFLRLGWSPGFWRIFFNRLREPVKWSSWRGAWVIVTPQGRILSRLG